MTHEIECNVYHKGHVCCKTANTAKLFFFSFSFLFFWLLHRSMGKDVTYDVTGHKSQGHMVVWETSAQTR